MAHALMWVVDRTMSLFTGCPALFRLAVVYGSRQTSIGVAISTIDLMGNYPHECRRCFEVVEEAGTRVMLHIAV